MKITRLLQPLAVLAIVVSPDGGVAARSVEQPSAAPMPASVFREIARRQNPAVVSITARLRVHAWDEREEDVFRLFGLVPPPAGERVQHEVASGFIISAVGDILTNNHILEGADTIEVVGLNVAVLDAEDDSNIGIGFAVPINSVKALLPQLRNGKVVRGHLGAQLHDGPILEDEAQELGLPKPIDAIVKSVDRGSTAGRAGLRAGDVIVEVDGHTVADTRDLVARTSSTTPGTRVSVKIFRGGTAETRTIVIEELPIETACEAPAGAPSRDGGLTLDAIASPAARRFAVPPGLDGALIVKVAPGSAADEADLNVGDINSRD